MSLKDGEKKVSTTSSIKTNTVKENVEESINEAPNEIGSTDEENLDTIVDASNPWSKIKEGKIKRLSIKERTYEKIRKF